MERRLLSWFAGIAASLVVAGVAYAFSAESRMSTMEAQYPEIMRRLESIENKIDSLRRPHETTLP